MFPIKDNVPGRHPIPIATVALIGLNALVFLLQIGLSQQKLEGFVYLFGIVPARYTHPAWAAHVGFPDNYWPFLTSTFLHGGWLHIIANMWTLWIFGDNVEERMGTIRFLLYYLLCGIVAGIIHTITNSSSTIPVVGASGAIAGVLAAYSFLFPLARIICLVPILFYPVFIEVYAFFYMIIWFFLQFYSGTLSLLAPGHPGGIAWWAHIGGFCFGVLAHRFFLPREHSRQTLQQSQTGLEGAWRKW